MDGVVVRPSGWRRGGSGRDSSSRAYCREFGFTYTYLLQMSHSSRDLGFMIVRVI